MMEFPNAMEVFKLLNKSNCRKCNEQTCLAFASKIDLGRIFGKPFTVKKTSDRYPGFLKILLISLSPRVSPCLPLFLLRCNSCGSTSNHGIMESWKLILRFTTDSLCSQSIDILRGNWKKIIYVSPMPIKFIELVPFRIIDVVNL